MISNFHELSSLHLSNEGEQLTNGMLATLLNYMIEWVIVWWNFMMPLFMMTIEYLQHISISNGIAVMRQQLPTIVFVLAILTHTDLIE